MDQVITLPHRHLVPAVRIIGRWKNKQVYEMLSPLINEGRYRPSAGTIETTANKIPIGKSKN